MSVLGQSMALFHLIIQASRSQAPLPLGPCHICKVKATAIFRFSQKGKERESADTAHLLFSGPWTHPFRSLSTGKTQSCDQTYL